MNNAKRFNIYKVVQCTVILVIHVFLGAKEKSTKPPPSCVDERNWCKNVNKKKCDNTIYDNDPTRDDLYKDVCKKLCNNC